jgi:hypothetical protein
MRSADTQRDLSLQTQNTVTFFSYYGAGHNFTAAFSIVVLGYKRLLTYHGGQIVL